MELQDMPLLRLKMRLANFLTATFLICFICLFSNSGFSQTNPLPPVITVGIRTAAFPIGHKLGNSYGGFCDAFVKELKEVLNNDRLSTQVRVQDIENEYLGKNYPRFDGLIIDQIQIECGPNSRSSLKLPDVNRDNKPFSDKIELSDNNFYTTTIRLLVKKNTAEELNKASGSELEKKT
jgi:polar amino acid transport system substrate-binding protein